LKSTARRLLVGLFWLALFKQVLKGEVQILNGELGATSVTLMKPVNWEVGGEIVIATTDYEAEQTERRYLS
jgi:hypothetical protein